MKAWNAEDTEKTRRLINRLQTDGWYHSIELPGGQITPGLQTPEQLRRRVRQFPIPDDLRGKRVLDIGAWDGWFSFEMERRGATVVAVDATRSDKLLYAREALGSKIEYRIADVYDLRPAEFGLFDIVLFLGVLYHLKHPLLALERVCALSHDMVCLESYVSDDGSESKPAMEFYETTELGGQFDNWVGPNVACLVALCRSTGFARVDFQSVMEHRAHVTCFRKWDSMPGTGPAPRIVSFDNATSHDLVFSAAKDDYASVWFKTEQTGLTGDDVFPQVGEYGAHPILVTHAGGDGWSVVFKVPPGIEPGWIPVRLRVRDSAYSNTVHFGVDIGAEQLRRRTLPSHDSGGFRIGGVADGKTWQANQVLMQREACISLWVHEVPAACRPEEILLRIDGRELPCEFVTAQDDPAGFRQVNALLPCGFTPGPAAINVAIGDAVTPPVQVEIVRDP